MVCQAYTYCHVVDGWDDRVSLGLEHPQSPIEATVSSSVPAHPRGRRILRSLVATLLHSDRVVRIHTVKILLARQTPPNPNDLDCESFGLWKRSISNTGPDSLFTDAALESVSNMALYEDEERAKRNALRLLENMVRADGAGAGESVSSSSQQISLLINIPPESKRVQVESALVNSYNAGLAQDRQQQIRAIEFLKNLERGTPGLCLTFIPSAPDTIHQIPLVCFTRALLLGSSFPA